MIAFMIAFYVFVLTKKMFYVFVLKKSMYSLLKRVSLCIGFKDAPQKEILVFLRCVLTCVFVKKIVLCILQLSQKFSRDHRKIYETYMYVALDINVQIARILLQVILFG